MRIRPLTIEDREQLERFLGSAAAHNPFHLSSLREFGLADASAPQGRPWALGAFRGEALEGVAMAFRGTGGIYHAPGDAEALETLAEVIVERANGGHLSLLSGHASQIEPLLTLAGDAGVGRPDRCHFRILRPDDLLMPEPVIGFGDPRLGTDEDMERLIDFYQVGFYSLANLPTRSAWRTRLAEQLAFRTLFFIEDADGRVASCALSSAEGGGAAMLGGVATLPLYRGRGLSALCVGALCDHLFTTGTDAISLFYLWDNDPAGRVYDKLGFAYDGEWLLAPVGFGVSFNPLMQIRPR